MGWDGWTELTTVRQPGEAAVLVSALIAAGIPARSDGNLVHLNWGAMPMGVRVYVPAERVAEAALVLRD